MRPPPACSPPPSVPPPPTPSPPFKDLAKQVEKMHNDIETLSEQYNGQREKLKTAKKAADAASEDAVHERVRPRRQAGQGRRPSPKRLHHGWFSKALAFYGVQETPRIFLNRAATTFRAGAAAGPRRSSSSSKAMDCGQARAGAGAKSRIDEVQTIVSRPRREARQDHQAGHQGRENLFRRALGEPGRPAPGQPGNLPVPGHGKAAAGRAAGRCRSSSSRTCGAPPAPARTTAPAGDGGVPARWHLAPALHRDQWTAGTHIDRSDLRPGDLVFFYTTCTTSGSTSAAA